MELRAALSYCPIVAILRGVKPDEVEGIGDALIEASVTVIEVPLNSPQPFESIRRLAARHAHHALVGAGTVLETADVARVKAAGGQLIVAPNFGADVVRAAKAAGLAALPGVMTPSEGFAALKAGAGGMISAGNSFNPSAPALSAAKPSEGVMTPGSAAIPAAFAAETTSALKFGATISWPPASFTRATSAASRTVPAPISA